MPSAADPVAFLQVIPPSAEESGAQEAAFRRGYEHGYAKAIEDMERLYRRGYPRTLEVRNMLREFAETALRAWRSTFSIPSQPPALTLPMNWRRTRARVFALAGHRCALCGSKGPLECDHIVPVKKGGLPVLTNLRALCPPCHQSVK